MPIISLLLALQAAPAAPAPVPAPAPAEKQICRRDVETGSRVGARRRCMTAAQWKAEARANADEIDRQRGYARSPN